jgi:hypothetical protein
MFDGNVPIDNYSTAKNYFVNMLKMNLPVSSTCVYLRLWANFANNVSALFQNIRDEFIKAFKPQEIIGEGGMGKQTAGAMAKKEQFTAHSPAEPQF